MKLEIGIQANCSEATIRIALKGVPEAKLKALKAKLTLELNNNIKDVKNQDWDDEDKREFDFSEGYISEISIFGMHVLEITGDAPYNFSKELGKIIYRYIPNAKTEWSEP